MTDSSSWNDILGDNERILWQGRPDPTFIIRGSDIAAALFGAIFAGFAVIWMVHMIHKGSFLWAFGLLHFSVGAGVILSSLFWPSYQRRHSWYSLSNKRAFIATDLPVIGRNLYSYPITHSTKLRLIDGPSGSVMFHSLRTTFRASPNQPHARGTRPGTYSARQFSRRPRTRTSCTGFERIHDAPHVFDLMQKIQAGAV
ncbi:aspartate carbamoyltransferase catalytic subunit [Roseovarius aestuarii]|nr:aspartate carbamoyltransferase catalytic subunit [Roseovarius aestuarii]